jgi:RNA polymerase sigma factor (sigma-70 family)
VVSGRDAPRVAAIDADAEAFVLLDPFADWVANYTTADALWSFADLDELRPQRVHDQRVVDLLWLRQFLYGAEACRRQFVRSLNPYFAWLVRKQGTVPASRVEDAVQEIWVKLLQNDFASLRTFQARARLKTFVSVVARNAVVDFVRRLNLQPDEDTPIDLVADASVATDTLMDERRLIGLGCRRLPLRQRRVLFLKYYLGFTAKEIAERLNTSANTVDVTAHEGRKRLAGIVENMTVET